MDAQPDEFIQLGGEDADAVPVRELRGLQALARRASPKAVKAAELEDAEEVVAQHRDWIANGCPGARSHDDVMNELLAPSGGWQPPA